MMHKILAASALTIMLIGILFMLFPNQSFTAHEIEGALIGLLSAILIETMWTKC